MFSQPLLEEINATSQDLVLFDYERMLPRMGSGIHYRKVLWVVVELIPILVMDMLVWLQGTTKMLRHSNTMLAHPLGWTLLDRLMVDRGGNQVWVVPPQFPVPLPYPLR